MQLPKKRSAKNDNDRTRQFNFRLTELERARLALNAEAQGYEHLAEFVRACLIQMGAM